MSAERLCLRLRGQTFGVLVIAPEAPPAKHGQTEAPLAASGWDRSALRRAVPLLVGDAYKLTLATAVVAAARRTAGGALREMRW